ncbi:MAG: glutamate formimidoyltransferase [Acidobacteriota bacterium]
MSHRLVECVTNISEGRNPETIAAIAEAIQKVPHAFLLDCSSDFDHHRSVYTFAGPPEPVSEAAFAAIRTAVERIDLRCHQGVHPRIGAADVVPLIPLRGVTMEECIELARLLGRKAAARLSLPVYLYQHAALNPGRRELAEIRRGGFERLREEICRDPKRQPDFGPPQLHPRAGATVIGARGLLIAFNIYLRTSDVSVARQIACQVRESGGGLPGVKALGFYLARRHQTQVSMNLTDFRRTPPAKVFERVRREGRKLKVDVDSSEIVGLVPEAALPPGLEIELRVENFHPGLILENRIEEALED